MAGTRSLTTEALVIGLACATARPTASSRSTRGSAGGCRRIAKGVRRTKSKVGGRLEPFSLVHVVLYPGRDSLHGRRRGDHPHLPGRPRRAVPHGGGRPAAGGRPPPVPRGGGQHPGAFNLLVRGVARLAAAPDRARRRAAWSWPPGSSCSWRWATCPSSTPACACGGEEPCAGSTPPWAACSVRVLRGRGPRLLRSEPGGAGGPARPAGAAPGRAAGAVAGRVGAARGGAGPGQTLAYHGTRSVARPRGHGRQTACRRWPRRAPTRARRSYAKG